MDKLAAFSKSEVLGSRSKNEYESKPICELPGLVRPDTPIIKQTQLQPPQSPQPQVQPQQQLIQNSLIQNEKTINKIQQKPREVKVLAYQNKSLLDLQQTYNKSIENININMTLLMQNRNLINLIFNYLNSSNLQEIEEESEELQQLSLEEFNKLPIQKITDQEDIECAICIDKFEKENEIIKLNCNHIYHKDCIKNYLLNYNNKCPMCRYKI